MKKKYAIRGGKLFSNKGLKGVNRHGGEVTIVSIGTVV